MDPHLIHCLPWLTEVSPECIVFPKDRNLELNPKSCRQYVQVSTRPGLLRRCHSGSGERLNGYYSSSDLSTLDDDHTSLSDDTSQSAMDPGLALGQVSTLRRRFSSPDLQINSIEEDMRSLCLNSNGTSCTLHNNNCDKRIHRCANFSGDLQLSISTDFQSEEGDSTSNKKPAAVEKVRYYPLLPSLFVDLPPTLRFYLPHEEGLILELPLEVRRVLLWKLSSITPILIRQTVCRSGYRLTRKNNDWVALWGKHIKSIDFQDIKDYQKVNHFPGSHNLGRKDNLLHHLKRCRLSHGAQVFDFLPDTFVLPKDLRALKQAWGQSWWIVKPPASARGSGIYVVYKWSQVPKKQATIVQRYIPDPYLINGTKFDLRLYVLVSTFNPLRIYVFKDGLVRFASVKYSPSVTRITDRFMHLTNYSINKKHADYTANENQWSYQGNKWTLQNLWRYLEEERGVDTQPLWEEIMDMIVKTVISAESGFSRLLACHVASRYSCYELFGFDILLDSQLRPWLLEVNISPSLHSASPLDATVKGELVKDMLNLVGFHVPYKLSSTVETQMLKTCGLSEKTMHLCLERLFYYPHLSPEERLKHQLYESGEDTCSILDNLTPDDCRHLMQGEDELSRNGGFLRLFPSQGPYLNLLRTTRYYNLLLDAWEHKFAACRNKGISMLQEISRTRYHLKGLRKKPLKKDSLNGSREEIMVPTLEVSHLNPSAAASSAVLPSSKRQTGRVTFKVPSKIRLGKGDSSGKTSRTSLGTSSASSN